MHRQSPERNRWTLMAVATMIMLLGSSVGCLSVKHQLRRHTVLATVAQKHQGRYYHCPHCGQIIPRKGFSKCPRCFQVPAYHGYEPTCWRQWPEGWGCPPESMVNGPDSLQHGMVESDSDLELLPEMEGQQPVETVVTGNDEVSMPQPQNDIVSAEHQQDAATETIPTANPVEPVDPASADNFVDIEPPASFDELAVADEPAKNLQTETPAVDLVAPVFEIVNRIPISTTKSTLRAEPLCDNVDVLDPPVAVPALVRPQASVINVTTASVDSKSVLIAAEPASRLNPHDEQVPISVRVVQLASITIDPKSTPRKEPTHHNVTGEFPRPVNRVALPELVPLLSSGTNHPMPIRRIQISELPVKIPR